MPENYADQRGHDVTWMTAAERTAKDARDTAFEKTVTAAGETLKTELAAAGDDKTARRAAWARYGDAQTAAGDAYRAAQAAERESYDRLLASASAANVDPPPCTIAEWYAARKEA